MLLSSIELSLQGGLFRSEGRMRLESEPAMPPVSDISRTWSAGTVLLSILPEARAWDEAYNLRTQHKFSNNTTTNPQENNNENVHSFNSGYRLNGAKPFAVCCDCVGPVK
jgi:hypothetical protein